MKQALAFTGFGLFLAASLLFGVKHFNVLKVNDAQSAITTTTTKAQGASQTTTTKKQESNTTQSTTKSSSSSQTTQTTTTTTQEAITFTVSSDDSSHTVADNLLSAGLIENVDTFNTYMETNDLSRSIQTGTFKLKKGMSLEELGKALTTYPGN